MRCLLALFTLCIVALQLTESRIILTSCARMDVPILDKVARGLCIVSCSTQNCGTGYCEKRSGRPTCVCSRCADGGNVPLEELVGRKGK